MASESEILTETNAAEAFTLIGSELDALEPTYLRRRRLLDGTDQNAIRYVEGLVNDISSRDGLDLKGLVAWARENAASLERVTLNTCGLLALENSFWDEARKLASEVMSRDHHDLLSQRIVDAANEQCRLNETEADRWLATRTCSAPFEQLETRVNRSVHFCCSAWQPIPIGRIDGDGEGFWTSEIATEIRRSVTEGDFSHCSRWHCPAIAARRLPKARPKTDKPVPASPRRVILSHDRSCNISCPSCRKDLILIDHASSRRLDELFEDRLLPLLANAEQIKVTGSGDPFGSRHFRSVLKALCAQDAPPRRLQLHTNGLLANERAWNDLGLWDNVSSVWVSVDAADEETYSELRRGGDFDQLLGALKFLGALRRAGAIESLRLDFVVQARNFDQMGNFVDLAQRVGADKVYFLRLRNWGHESADNFRKLDVCDQDHPAYDALLARLGDPRLAQPNVDLGSIATLRREAGATRVYG
jgi:hypothetical protein